MFCAAALYVLCLLVCSVLVVQAVQPKAHGTAGQLSATGKPPTTPRNVLRVYLRFHLVHLSSFQWVRHSVSFLLPTVESPLARLL